MQPNNSLKGPRWPLKVAYTAKPVSGWGGLIAIARFFDCLRLREVLRRALPDERTSNNQICAVDQVLAFFAAVLTGAQRFSHVERLRADDAVQAIFSIERMPSAATLTRYFNGFVRAQVEVLVSILWRFVLALVRLPPGGEVIDLDSTVITRFGAQEGSKVGYNPGRHGRRSHHPILAMMAGSKMVLNAWMRSGNSHTANGVCGFFAESVARLPSSARVVAVRADAGFCYEKFLTFLEERGTHYVVVLRQDAEVRSRIRTIREWAAVDDDHAVAEFTHQLSSEGPRRRVVVVRQVERDDTVGRKLFDVPGYSYRTFITDLKDPSVEVWRFYDHRADCENRIKELKDDFGAAGFCLQNFDGTDAAFRLVCFLFNLVAHFKANVTGDAKPHLKTLRSQLLVVGAILGADGRDAVLRLGLRGTRRAGFEKVLAAIDQTFVATALQGDILLPIQGLGPQRPWHPRGWKPPDRGAN